MINIFGKLYTLLRRPQEPPTTAESSNTEADATSAEASTSEDGAQSSSSATEAGKQECTSAGAPTSDSEEKPPVNRLSESPDSVEWEHVQRPENGGSGDAVDLEFHDIAQDVQSTEPFTVATDQDTPLTDIEAEKLAEKTDSKTKVTENNAADVNEETKDVGVEGGDDKTCEGGDTAAATDGDHVPATTAKITNKDSLKDKHANEPKTTATEEPVKKLSEKDYKTFTEFVHAKTQQSQLIVPKDLVYNLGYQHNTNQQEIGDALIGQYKLAVANQNWQWVANVRYFAELFFSQQWIDEHLPHKHTKSDRKKKVSNKQREKNDRWEKPGTMCRDFRLNENPEMERVVGNAAGDSPDDVINPATKPTVGAAGDNAGKVAEVESPQKIGASTGEVMTEEDDGTEALIQQAMKMAIKDGLSESLIMEVIDDVTSGLAKTPAKLTPKKTPRLAKVDINRTPRKRPDQLAMGFNYHADLVVKSSPKTVKGEIIVMDILSPARQRPEQLAVGFNFHAEQLVKESPKTETGEPIIPGIPLTPRRRARDQLAMGFNYHSNQIAGEVEEEKKEEEEDKENKQKKRGQPDLDDSPSKKIKQILGEYKSKTNIETTLSPSGKGRKKINELLAMGFSYNSDIELLSSVDKTTPAGMDRQELNNIRLADTAEVSEIDGTLLKEPGTPAGSVW